MFKIVKSELMKIFSGKMIYICAVLTMLLTSLNYISVKILLSVNSPEASQIVEEMASITTQDYIMQQLLSLISNGGFSIILIIILTYLITDDYSKGTMKYSLLAINKQELFIGKIIAVAIIELLLTVVGLITSGTIGVIAFSWSVSGLTVIQILQAYLYGWLGFLGFSCLVIFIIQNVSSTGGAIGVGLGIYLSIGIISMLIPQSIKPFIISANAINLIDSSKSLWNEFALTNIAYIIIFGLLSLIIFKRKEIIY